MDDEPKQATSFNLLLGRNLADTSRFKTHAAVLIGMRESVADCPDSVLGYQCWADTETDAEYDVNHGAVLTFTFDRTMVGVRVTGESTQALIGFRF